MVSLKIFVFSLFVLITVMSFAISAAAADSNGKIVQISRVSAYDDGAVSVNLNTGRKLTDAKVTVSVPELGIRAANRVDFSKGKKQTVSVELPVPGVFDPYVRIVFSSDEGRRVMHRPLILE